MKKAFKMESMEIKERHWNEWFAGLVDGDGSLFVSKKGYMSLEITMSIYDEKTLLRIKQKLQGSVKLRPNILAFRYRLHHKDGIMKAVNKLNGLCRNSKRVPQLKQVCQKLNIPYNNPAFLTLDNGWFSGFFDADGTLSYSFKKTWPQLEISVSNKKKIDCDSFHSFFNGRVYLDSNSNTYKWVITRKEDILFFYAYLKKYPLRSYKQKRILLIPVFMKLRNISAYAYSKETKTYKLWQLFEKRWSFD
jgi:hypothetical protein